jgi:hypothetical protein
LTSLADRVALCRDVISHETTRCPCPAPSQFRGQQASLDCSVRVGLRTRDWGAHLIRIDPSGGAALVDVGVRCSRVR